MGTTTVNAGSRFVTVSRPDKVLFPRDGITKLDLAEYYATVGPAMLPHLAGRPLAAERYPDGLTGEHFLQKRAASGTPGWVTTATVDKQGGRLRQIVCDDVATLVWLADQACITPHVWLSRTDRPRHPDQLIFDLDPGEGGFASARRAALRLRGVLDELGLPSHARTTGGRGIHVLVPLDRAADFAAVRAFARSIADLLARRDPQHLTTAVRKQRRRGRLLIDVMRNAYAQHVAAPYAVRARDGAPVAVPLHWSEVESRSLGPEAFGMKAAVERLRDSRDPWGAMPGLSLVEPGRRLETMTLTDAGRHSAQERETKPLV